MSHPSETILAVVQGILKNGKTLAKDSYSIDQMIHPDDRCLPKVIIYSNSEDVELIDQAPKRQMRTMALTLEVLMQRPTEPEVSNQLKQLVWQIELLLSDSDTWQGNVNKQNLTGLRYEFREQGTVPIGHCQMTYEVEYITVLPDSVLTQKSANVSTDDTILQGVKNTFPEPNGGGWDLVGDGGAPQPGDPDNEVEAELLIESLP